MQRNLKNERFFINHLNIRLTIKVRKQTWKMNDKFKQLITDGDFNPLINYESMGREAMLAIPTPEHYLPF